jgi:hypothetical protein
MEGNENQEITWNVALEKLLAEEGEKALGLAWLHNQCEAYYGARSNWISIPVIILSTLSGTASASSTTFFADNIKMGSLGIGAISILCGILNTVNSYFAFSKRTEAHRIADIQFNKVYRFIAVEMTLPRIERIRARDMLKIVREQVERLAETSPAIPEFIVDKFKKNFRKDYKDVAQPDITNGLRRIRVNQTGVVSPPMTKTPRVGSTSSPPENTLFGLSFGRSKSTRNDIDDDEEEGESDSAAASPDTSIQIQASSALSEKIKEIANIKLPSSGSKDFKVVNPLQMGVEGAKLRAASASEQSEKKAENLV